MFPAMLFNNFNTHSQLCSVVVIYLVIQFQLQQPRGRRPLASILEHQRSAVTVQPLAHFLPIWTGTITRLSHDYYTIIALLHYYYQI